MKKQETTVWIAETTSWCPETGSHTLFQVCEKGKVSYKLLSEYGTWGSEIFEGTLEECFKEFQDKVEMVSESYKEIHVQ
tara:strand:- start:422 stop:658 length:237 start_codon:yes stop_codon:yes gene_type:complete